ncbi:MAG: tyrosine protein phosphatase [Streptococcaceae bacterium]|jgi:protein-tyrosine phosphatase|nr:tyrosine protein phosphatase [Streptococcaceae bacterium]
MAVKGLVDLHCHLLPSLDDGPEDWKLTLQMLKKFAAEGVTHINASPHFDSDFQTSHQDIFQKVEQINQLCEDQALPIKVFPSQEVHIFGELVAAYQAGEILSIANRGNYLLLEFESNQVPLYADELIYQLALEGITPVIAHPERNFDFMKHPEKLIRFVQRGALTQLTASCITGDFGRKFHENAEKLFKMNLVHLIASDAHNVTSRASKMREAFEVVESQYGRNLAEQLNENAWKVLNGEKVIVDEPRVFKKKWFGRFKS